MIAKPLLLAAALVSTAALAEPAPIEVHYAPSENLERIDAALIASARTSLDVTAYTLTDRAVIETLRAAQARGVAVRILIDPRQAQARDAFGPLTATIHESTRNPWMHLKSYAVDGALLRTGSANFSGSGEKQQDNDLVILRDRETAQKFEARFAAIWTAGRAYAGEKPGDARAQDLDHPAGCTIKGNVNRKGEHLYHLPTDPAYARVTMNAPQKRWFCSEADATAAGWRHVGSGH